MAQKTVVEKLFKILCRACVLKIDTGMALVLAVAN
jgi:hypothetical protein